MLHEAACLDEVTQEQLESLFEVLGQTQAQILTRIDKIRPKNGKLSQELEERLILMLASPAKLPYP